jgi:hypothetical protein
MKHIIFIFTISILISITSTLKAQDEKCFNKGTSVANIGVGTTDNFGLVVVSNFTHYPYSIIKPILTGSYEYGIAKVGKGVIGAGLSVNYSSYHTVTDASFAGGGSYKNNETDIIVGLRVAYHPDFCNGKNYDVYGAVQLNVYGYAFSRISNALDVPSYNNSSIRRILPSLLVGARYFFIPNVGVFAEFGYDYAIIKGGISLKFGGMPKA